MREIVLDTETTGLDPRDHRIVEIGCLELINHIPTGEIFHTYLNPKCEIAAEAFNIHGLDAQFLADKPVFGDIAVSFTAFIAEAPLVIHNAAFDMGFLNSEFDRIGFGKLPPGRSIDTLMIARRKFPGGQNSLDGLCRRFAIDNSQRTRHGALLDAELLAEVYLELIGGRQRDLGLNPLADVVVQNNNAGVAVRPARTRPLLPLISAGERAAHEAFIAGLGGTPLWGR